MRKTSFLTDLLQSTWTAVAEKGKVAMASLQTGWLARAVMLLLFGVMTTAAWAGIPDNFLDKCTGGDHSILVVGWAFDPDASAQSIEVHVYIYTDESCSQQYGDYHRIMADVSRPDVNAARNITGNHGFDATIPVDDLGEYWVKVYAIDTNGDGNPQIGNTTKVTVKDSQKITLSGNESYTAQDGDILTGSTSGWVWIAPDASVTLSNVTLTSSIICEGSATITLVGTNSVTGAQFMAGIQIGGEGTTLTIKGEGSLTANGSMQSAGIGLSRAWNPAGDVIGGDIVIEGGNITANGSLNDQWGAGIGTGVIYGNGLAKTVRVGNITIKGGTVTANGGTGANGIGTGYCYPACTNEIGAVTIYDSIEMVDASSIRGSVTYMHGATNVTANANAYFTITEASSRYIIMPKDDTNYTITIADGIEHGTVTANRATAKLGEYVTLTITPDFYYRLGALNVKNTSNNKDVSVSNNMFMMPRGNVTVSATFIENTATFDDNTEYDNHYDDPYLNSLTYIKRIGWERVGKYQAWLVPFDYTIKAEDMDKFQFYKINMIANSPSPEVEASEQMWVFLKKLDAGAVLHANMPYVYKPLEAVPDYAFTSVNTLLKARNEGVLAMTQTMEDIYSFYATYDNLPINGNDPFYYVNDIGSISLSSFEFVGPFRWIIRKTSKYEALPSYAPEMKFFDVDDETGINELEGLDAVDEKWYTLDGKKISRKSKGIYIHNGQKKVVR